MREEIFDVVLTQYCAGGKIEKNEIGAACGAYGGEERWKEVIEETQT
jgi:hypothetical protein